MIGVQPELRDTQVLQVRQVPQVLLETQDRPDQQELLVQLALPVPREQPARKVLRAQPAKPVPREQQGLQAQLVSKVQLEQPAQQARLAFMVLPVPQGLLVLLEQPE